MKTLGLLVLFCGMAAAQERPAEERSRRAYDVRFLTRSIQNYPGPELYKFPGESGVPGITEGVDPLITEDFLNSAIVTNFDADSWDDSRNSIHAEEGILFVTQTAEVHAMIQGYIDMLRRRFSRRIVVDADVLLVAPSVLAGIAPGVLSDDQARALRDAAGDPARGVRVAALRAVAMNGQRVHAADIQRQTYVGDYDPEIAHDRAIADPVVHEVRGGAVLDVRPWIALDGTTLVIETRFQAARLLAMGSIEPGASPLGVIQLPVRELARSRSTVGCPAGRTVLVMTATPPGAEKGWTLALLLKPSVAGEGGDDKTVSSEKRHMRIFDVSSIVHEVPEFPGPDLGVKFGAGSEPSPAALFETGADVGAAISVETLTDMIRENVGQGSWENSKNVIEVLGNQLVVVQTPEVLDAIAKYLSSAFPHRARLLSVEAVVVALDEASWTSRRDGFSSPSVDEAARELLEFASKGERAWIAGSASGLGLNNQRFHCHSGIEKACLEDYDVYIAEGIGAADPIMGRVLSAVQLDVRATMAGDGRRILLDLRPAFCSASEPGTWDTKAAQLGRLQKLRTTELTVRTQSMVEENTWSLAGITSRSDASGKREFLVMLVRARSLEVK